jgi:hypothetical protein
MSTGAVKRSRRREKSCPFSSTTTQRPLASTPKSWTPIGPLDRVSLRLWGQTLEDVQPPRMMRTRRGNFGDMTSLH